MANHFEQELLEDVSQTSAALARMVEDEDLFHLAVQSFRAQDHEGFRGVLSRYELLDLCPLICRWMCSKHCTLVCFELCGPPPLDPPVLDLRTYADVIAKVSEDQEVLERLAGAVIERDEASFRAIVEKLGVQRYCHYICQWICTIRCGLVCDILCATEKPAYIIGCVHLLPVLQQAATAVLRLASDRNAFAEVEKAALARDCDAMRTAIERAGLRGVCQWICVWICSWTSVRVCMHLCLPFPPKPIIDELPEIHAFAKAVARLQTQPEGAAALIKAVVEEDAQTYAELVEKLSFQPYCHQLCFWINRLWCRRFCWCVCPEPLPRPWFTHVGHFHIYGDIDSTTGLTNKAMLGHGGPNYGFFGCLELRGFCPADSPTVASAPMRYRFLYEQGSTRTPLVGALLCQVIVGSRTIYWDVNGTGLEETFQTVSVAGAGATLDPTPPPPVPPGTPWGPPPAHVVVPDADGWIAVDPNALGAGFNGALIGFNTPSPLPGGPANAGVNAGDQIPAANLKAGTDVALIFEATRIGGPVSPPDFTNSLSRIHINNWEEARLLDILQFHTGGGTPCSPLSTDLDIEYSADHELMAAWDLRITTAASIPVLTLPSGAATRAGTSHTAFGTHHEDISAWPSCSYTVRLRTRRALTTGLTDDPANDTPKTFCIGWRNTDNG